MTIKRLIKKFKKDYNKNNHLNYGRLSYAQEGEDLILSEILKGNTGFYIDVGSYHPFKYSNTYLFYKKGWHGINLDATPGSMELFNKLRGEDINLEIAISNSEEEKKFYMFNEPALNTFSKEEADRKNKMDDYYIIKEQNIVTLPLRNILSKYLSNDKVIDLLNIDAEGLDLEILESNDWETYYPKVVSVECLNLYVEDLIKNKTFQFLKKLNYRLIAKTTRTLIFISQN